LGWLGKYLDVKSVDMIGPVGSLSPRPPMVFIRPCAATAVWTL